jgi:beta-lactam-binding protein with PASTA domain/tRNA A-37 threonylcarbamoyl transferase component Bud32
VEREPIVLGGRYRVEEELGRGGMAKVYRGNDTVLGRPVAVKILAPQFADDPSFVDRFRREAQAAARLNHPNLVSVYDTGSDDGIHFIVMEYVEGKTLADYLTGGGRIMPQRAIEIAEAVSQALTAAHAQGVIHRDIKPGNIMITPSGDVKVADFGIARMIASAETIAQTAAVLGTAAYLSPEQAQGQPVDQRSDLYSLGCVLYEMVAGRPPFTGDSPVAVASKQVLEQPVPPSRLNPDVSPQLEAVIMRTLAKNPANRYESAEEFRRDLERARRGDPVEATPLMPESAATQVISRPGGRDTMVLPAQESDRSRWWVWPLVLVVLLGLGLVLFFVAKNLLTSNTPAAAQVVVPKVTGLQLADARNALEGAGLKVDEIITKVPDPTKDPGMVVAQDPLPGKTVNTGTVVHLTVVKAPGDVTIPSVQDLPADEAQTKLQDAGFHVIPAEESSTTVTAGNVTRTDPPEGTSAPSGSDVTMYVSTGAGSVVVPDVTCLSFGQAKNLLLDKGLSPIQSSETVPLNPACPHGNKVAAQDPAANSTVDSGSTVTLFPGSEESPAPTGPTGATGPTA